MKMRRYFSELVLVQMCRNPDHIVLRNPAGEDIYLILQANEFLIPGNCVHTDVINIVKCTVVGEGFNMKIVYNKRSQPVVHTIA